MKKRNRLLSVLLMSFVLLLLTQISAFGASAPFSIGTKKYNSLMDAFNNVKDGETIKLRTDFDVYGCGLNKKANVTLDLNGHNLNISPWGNISIEKGSLTVIGKGSIKKNGKSGSMFFVWKSGTLNLNADADYLGAINIDGKVNIQKGRFENMKSNRIALIQNRGRLTIKGGSFRTNCQCGIIQNHMAGRTTISGGTFRLTGKLDLEQTDVYDPARDSAPIIEIVSYGEKEGKVTINGGTFNSNSIVFRNNGGQLLVKKGTFKSGAGVLWNTDDGECEFVDGTYSVRGGLELATNAERGKLTVSGGIYTSEWSLFENWGPNTVLKITGGKMTTTMRQDESAMVLNMGGKTTISGGSFTGKKTNGYWKGSGTITVSGNPTWNVLKKNHKGNLNIK